VSRTIRIVSGGQTGVDRAALDAALEAGAPCGGWCAHDRRAEDGIIPPRYPVMPLAGADNRARTRQNVADSDATAIICTGPRFGGTLDTLNDCKELHKPSLALDPSLLGVAEAAARLHRFVAGHAVVTLNVAGPRKSEQPTTAPLARAVMSEFLRLLTSSEPR
jgi:hypothetical protein